MNDHNLDDLIIDTVAPKNTKPKNLLTLAALLIIILIVGIILTKTLLKSPKNDPLTFEENLTEMVAPELKLQKSTEIEKPKEETSLSTIIEEKATNEQTEVKAPEVQSQETHISKEKSTPALETQKPKPVVHTTPIHTQEQTAIELPEMQKTVEKKLTPKPVAPTKPKVVKAHTKTKKPIIKHRVPNTVSKGHYYVQVGSFKQNPSPRFLSVIKSSGFTCHITTPDRTGYKKLLIGPYKTREDVDKARDIIRDRIHKSAFVVQK